MLLRCARALRVPPDDLIHDARVALGGGKPHGQKYVRTLISRQEAKLLRLARILDAVEDKAVRNHLVGLARRYAALAKKTSGGSGTRD